MMHSFTHEKLKLKPHRNTISHPSDWQIFKSLTTHFVEETIKKYAPSYNDGGDAKWYILP